MVKVIVTGAGGKMGGRIISLISAMEDIRVVGATRLLEEMSVIPWAGARPA